MRVSAAETGVAAARDTIAPRAGVVLAVRMAVVVVARAFVAVRDVTDGPRAVVAAPARGDVVAVRSDTPRAAVAPARFVTDGVLVRTADALARAVDATSVARDGTAVASRDAADAHG